MLKVNYSYIGNVESVLSAHPKKFCKRTKKSDPEKTNLKKIFSLFLISCGISGGKVPGKPFDHNFNL